MAGQEPTDQRHDRQDHHRRDEHGAHPVGQALHRSAAALGLLDQADDLGQGGVGADLGGLDHQRAVGVDRGTDHGVAGADLDRDGLAGQQGQVDGGVALDDQAVGGHLLARAHDEAVAHDEIVDGDLAPVGQAGGLGAELGQRPQGVARPVHGPGFEPLAHQDQRGDDGGRLEVDVGDRGRRRVHAGHRAHAAALVGGAEEQQGHRRPRPRRQGAHRDERVHGDRAVAEVDPGRPVELGAGPEHDRRRQGEGQPLPAGEHQGRHHRDQHHGHREDGGHDEAPGQAPFGGVVQRLVLVAGVRVVCPLLGSRGAGVIAGPVRMTGVAVVPAVGGGRGWGSRHRVAQ